MQDAYHSLVKDTILFFQHQKSPFFLARREDIPFLVCSQKKEPCENKKELPFPAISVQKTIEKKPTIAKQKEAKSKPLPKEEKESVVPPPPPLPLSSSFFQMQEIIQSVCPQMKLQSTLPNDARAKQIAQSWFYKKREAAITLLCGQEDLVKMAFLKNLTKAIHLCLRPACMMFAAEIEKENRWELFLSSEQLQLIIAVESSLATFPRLMSFYREFPSRKEKFLHTIPLFYLPDIGLYLKTSTLKALLWKTIQDKVHEILP